MSDPRPRVVTGPAGGLVEGMRCVACGHPVASAAPRCPDCGGRLTTARFGPAGTVWSSTTVNVPVPGREPPYALAYVDLDDGPRILAHVRAGSVVAPGTRVRVAGPGALGDVEVEVG